MANTLGKARKTRAKKKKKTVRKKRAERKSLVPVDGQCTTELRMNGSHLVIKLSHDEHPEIFDLDRLLKQMQQVTRSYRRKKKMRDVVEFLCETEKSLQIILKNHLQDAMRMYFR